MSQLVDLAMEAYQPLFRKVLQDSFDNYEKEGFKIDKHYVNNRVIAFIVSKRTGDEVYIAEVVSTSKNPKLFFKLFRNAIKGAAVIITETENPRIQKALKRLKFQEENGQYILRRKTYVRSS